MSARAARVVLCALLVATGAARAREAPAWLVEAARDTASAAAPDAPAIDLLRERTLEVAEDGARRRIVRSAVRVRDADGRPWATDGVAYLAGSGRVTDVHAWRIAPGGAVTEFGRAQVVDRAVDPSSLYDEGREQELDLERECKPGDVLGWEWVVEERGVVAQDLVRLQRPLPARVSRVVLRLPPGWSAEAVTFHHDALAPRVEGGAWSWEARDLPDLREEPDDPPFAALAARLGVSWFPAAGRPSGAPGFRTWPDVGRWLSALAGPETLGGDAVRARAHDLAGAAVSDLDRVRRIGRFVQDMPYASIQMGLEHGAGYRPRPAARVLLQGYGDCKDKANLVRALLGEVGLRAWLVVLYSGDPDVADPRWPSPESFDHCIVAVSAPWAAAAPAAVRDSTLGTLLLFDPTDPTTPVGALPPRLAGGLALVEAGDSSAVLRVPDAGAAGNTLRREVRGAIAPDGGLAAAVVERSVGDEATAERRLYRHETPEAYRGVIERWVARTVNGARLTALRVSDERDSSAFGLEVAFEAPRYAARVGDGLLAFRPALVSRREAVNLGESRRRVPVRLEAESWEEVATLALPAGCAVDELPESATVETPFARYETRCEVKGGTLTSTRRLAVRRADVPVARFTEVRDFFLRVAALEQSPVVLRGAAAR